MQTRTKPATSKSAAYKSVVVAGTNSMSYNSFLNEANRLITTAKQTGISRQDQLLYIIELFTLIERNVVKVYMTEILDFPNMHERFLKLINVIYKKADEIYNDIGKMLTEEIDKDNISLCISTIQAVCQARTELLAIAEKRIC
jgi:hypothetical protein